MPATLRYPVSEKERADFPDYGCGYACAPYEHTTDVLEPNCSCPMKTMGHRCRNRYCREHGHQERRKQAARRVKYDYTGVDTYSCTLQFGGWLSYGHFTEVRQQFVAGLRAVFGKIPHWYNAEFENGRPHIHFVFRVPLGSDVGAVGASVRKCWREALPAGNIPWAGQRVGVALVGKTYHDVRQLFGYIAKTNRNAYGIREARPVGWRLTTFTSRDWCSPDTRTTAEHMLEVAHRLGILESVVQPDTVTAPAGHGPSISSITLTSSSPTPTRRRGRPSSRGYRECNTTNGRWGRRRKADRRPHGYKFARTVHDTS